VVGYYLLLLYSSKKGLDDNGDIRKIDKVLFALRISKSFGIWHTYITILLYNRCKNIA
jgi:hypothetical protein